MLKKTISYTDYDGNQRTEDFYFNLSKAEITEMELSMEGGMRAYIQRIIAAKSQLELVKLFKDVVLKSYGKKSADGRLFMKNDTIRAEFEAHPAYSMIYMDLVTDEAKASAFVNGIMPADMPNQNPAMEMAATASAASAVSLIFCRFGGERLRRENSGQPLFFFCLKRHAFKSTGGVKECWSCIFPAKNAGMSEQTCSYTTSR